jgi:hypothetical protein
MEKKALLGDVELGLRLGNYTYANYHHNNDRPPLTSTSPEAQHHHNKVNGFEGLPDEVLLMVFGWLPTFRDRMALQATDRRWRLAAAGHREFEAERAQRMAKGRWYHEEMRGRAKREREAKSKQRNVEWLKERERELLLGQITPEEAPPEVVAKRKLRQRITLVVVAIALGLYTVGMVVYLTHI